MSETLVDQVAEAIWGASSAFGLARTWADEAVPVRQAYESQARAALDVLERAEPSVPGEPTDAEAWAAAHAVAGLRKSETGAPAWFNVEHARVALRAAAATDREVGSRDA